MNHFSSLTEEEVIEAFGPLPEEVVKWIEGTTTFSLPKDKDVIKKFTKAFKRWFKKGLAKCRSIEEKKGLKNWLEKELVVYEE